MIRSSGCCWVSSVSDHSDVTPFVFHLFLFSCLLGIWRILFVQLTVFTSYWLKNMHTVNWLQNSQRGKLCLFLSFSTKQNLKTRSCDPDLQVDETFRIWSNQIVRGLQKGTSSTAGDLASTVAYASPLPMQSSSVHPLTRSYNLSWFFFFQSAVGNILITEANAWRTNISFATLYVTLQNSLYSVLLSDSLSY